MAIKGKRKTGSRGSQARRRPAGAPRPSLPARERVPWHRTERGRVGLALGLLVAVVAVWSLVARSQEEGAERARAQDALEGYAGEIRTVAGEVQPGAGGMAQASPDTTGAALRALAGQAGSWTTSLRRAERELGQVRPPLAGATAHGLFSQSISLYISAAKTFATAADAPADLATRLLQRAVDQRDAAGTAWILGTQELDRELGRAELPPSGVAFPGAPVPGAGADLPEEPAAGGAGDGDGGNGGGGADGDR